MVRVLEVIFRRPLQFLLLLVVMPIIGVAITYVQPRIYSSTASLWALQRYEVIGATGPESDLQSTPADTQATALTELLQSRVFALSVADSTKLASTFDAPTQANLQLLDDTMFTDISTHVVVTSAGYNLFTITYQNHNPYVAQQVVQSVVQKYSEQSVLFAVVEAQHLLDSYRTQLAKAQQSASQAASAVSNYLVAHPALAQLISRTNVETGALNDPQYAILYSQAQQTQTNSQNIQTNISTVQQELSTEGTNSNNLFKILDNPQIPYKSLSRTKTYLLYGGVGAGIALLACILLILVAVRRDRTFYVPTDFLTVTTLPLVMQVPHLNGTNSTLLLGSGLRNERL